jgi:ABC-type phosphate transport system ATPase subunit
MTINEKGILDYTGSAISWLCAAHCVLMTPAVTVLPLDEATSFLDPKASNEFS